MKPILRYILTLFLLTLAENFISAGNSVAASEVFIWKEHSVLPPSPANSVQPGLAGAFSGVADGLFIVAGGANFPDRLPWEGETKTWWDDIYVYYSLSSQPAWVVHPQKLPHPEALSITVSDGDAIFPSFIFNRMPAGVFGLLISGIFAAAMSTLSSSMNSAATAWSVDIHFRFGWSQQASQLKVARMATLVLGLLGILFTVMMATWDIKSLWDEFNKMLGLVMGGLGGLFLLGMVSRRANGTGALVGIIGSILVQVWISKTQPVHLLLYAATGFISCFLIGYFTSLIFSKDRKEIAHLTIYKHFKRNN